MNVTINLELHTKRCSECRRWFGTESAYIWQCGSCADDHKRALRANIARLSRANAALRGALKRSKSKRVR